MSAISSTGEQIRRIMTEKMSVDPDQITDDGNIFSDFGFDSLDGVELILVVEDELSITFDDAVLDRKSMTVSELIAIAEELTNSTKAPTNDQ